MTLFNLKVYNETFYLRFLKKNISKVHEKKPFDLGLDVVNQFPDVDKAVFIIFKC